MNARHPAGNGHVVGTAELAARARVTVRQIQHWTTVGYLHAEERPGLARQGSFLRYGPDEIRCALVLSALVHIGVIPHVAADAARRALVDDDSGHFGTTIGTAYIVGKLP